MTRWQIIGLLLAVSLTIWLAWLYTAPHFDTRPEQDACSFGPVTNERYRELLAEARRRQASGRWSRLRGDGGDMNANLQFRLDDLMDGMGSIYERIAAMHAVMRALGANYRITEPDFVDAFESARRRSRFVDFGSVGFVYTLDVHRVGGFAPVNKNATIHNRCVADSSQVAGWRDKENDTFSVKINYPFTLLYPPRWINAGRYNQICPAVPGPEWVADYSEWLDIANVDGNT